MIHKGRHDRLHSSNLKHSTNQMQSAKDSSKLNVWSRPIKHVSSFQHDLSSRFYRARGCFYLMGVKTLFLSSASGFNLLHIVKFVELVRRHFEILTHVVIVICSCCDARLSCSLILVLRMMLGHTPQLGSSVDEVVFS